MIKIQLQPQCYDCNDVDIKTETEKLFSGIEIIETYCTVECSHANVCKKISTDEKE